MSQERNVTHFLAFLGGAFLLCAVGLLMVQVELRKRRKKRFAHPIVCVCRVNDRVGIVLRQDYDMASQNFWESFLDGANEGDCRHLDLHVAQKISVSPTFVLVVNSQEFALLTRDCWLEEAIFALPQTPMPLNVVDVAGKYLHGSSWKNAYVPLFLVGERL